MHKSPREREEPTVKGGAQKGEASSENNGEKW